jgi:ACS family hexuronate transporter-like MFS transporter
LGLLWIIPWLIVNKNTPDKHPWITKEEQDHISDKNAGQAKSVRRYDKSIHGAHY